MWVHIVCNIGYQSTQADKRAYDKSPELHVNMLSLVFNCFDYTQMQLEVFNFYFRILGK